ncbi:MULTISPECIES: hypothetical protein [unclassified Streptomyces]|uniref:hypothetical protein n=1 Tax=unclassified Streptomyces TaxID=2593676 RepID=UPI00278C2543|nr:MULTISPECIES: hypothetical protein [unclassified Streptomyces]
MIGSRIGPATPSGRWGRLVSVIGFVVVVIAHLAGTVHASTPAGGHLDVTVTACGHHGAAQSPGQAAAPGPAHHHSAGDGHVEHLADRPRASGPTGPSLSGPDAPPLTPLALATTTHGPGVPDGHPPDRPPRPSSGGAAHLLLCVWRQ